MLSDYLSAMVSRNVAEVQKLCDVLTSLARQHLSASVQPRPHQQPHIAVVAAAVDDQSPMRIAHPRAHIRCRTSRQAMHILDRIKDVAADEMLLDSQDARLRLFVHKGNRGRLAGQKCLPKTIARRRRIRVAYPSDPRQIQHPALLHPDKRDRHKHGRHQNGIDHQQGHNDKHIDRLDRTRLPYQKLTISSSIARLMRYRAESAATNRILTYLYYHIMLVL